MKKIGEVYSLSKPEKSDLVGELKKGGWNVVMTNADLGIHTITKDEKSEKTIGRIYPNTIHTMNHEGLEKFISEFMIRKKLEALGFSEDTLDIGMYIQTLRSVSRLEDLKREFAKRNINYLDEEPFLIPIFGRLYEQDEKLRKRVTVELGNSRIPIEIIENYFTEMGTQPDISLKLSKKYEKIPSYMKTRFSDMAREVMFKEVKSYLEN